MSQHPGHSLGAPDARYPVRGGRFWLLMLLVLLPVAVALAAPEPLHPLGEPPADSSVHAHDPSETPVCHHGGHQHTPPALVADKRELHMPASGEGSDKGPAALPSQGPTAALIPAVDTAAPERFSRQTDNTPPIYLLTQRFRA